MNKYADYLTKDMRLVLLRILVELPRCTSNSSVLANLLYRYGHNPSRDMVKTQITWLCEQGLLTMAATSDVLVCTLTDQGRDVAQGRASNPGVGHSGG